MLAKRCSDDTSRPTVSRLLAHKSCGCKGRWGTLNTISLFLNAVKILYDWRENTRTLLLFRGTAFNSDIVGGRRSLICSRYRDDLTPGMIAISASV